MLRAIAALAVLAVAATAVLAQNTGAITQRKDTMKAFSAAAKVAGAMAKGEAKFDLAKVQASLKALESGAAKAKIFFPDDSKSGDTAVLPVAFTNKADLLAKFDKLAADAKAAQAAIKDEATFKATWPKMLSNCGGCHKVYRKPPPKKS
jgi:cytochrome c556